MTTVKSADGVLDRRRDTAIILARAPRLGTVKRRLAGGIGARAALQFHVETLGRTLRLLATDRRFSTVLAVTPDLAAFRLPIRVPRIPQGRGDIGARMARAFRRFPCRTVLVGSDIPGLAADDIAAAFRALGRADAVFGPAKDGGYWLVGMGPRRPARPFAAVRWSSANALADTLANFRGRRIALLRTMQDVDTAADLATIRSATARCSTTPKSPPTTLLQSA